MRQRRAERPTGDLPLLDRRQAERRQVPQRPKWPWWRRDLYSRSFELRWSARLALAWVTALVVAWIGQAFLSERLLPFTVLLYGPRFLLLTPFGLLLPLTLLFARRWFLLLLGSLGVLLGPIMGGRVHLATLRQSSPPLARDARSLRVLTLNAEGGAVVVQQLGVLFESYRPDLLAFQECGPELGEALAQLKGWSTQSWQSLCVASRWPITAMDTMPRATFSRVSELGFGGAGLVMRTRVAHPEGPLDLVTVHLETARKGLEWMLADVPPELAAPDLNARIRTMESERTAVWAGVRARDVATIITGDFNLPVESRIYRDHWTGYDNAFEEVGTGFGFTKHEGRWLHIRIDHVLTAPDAFDVLGAWVGMPVGSDHRPVIADLKRRPRPS